MLIIWFWILWQQNHAKKGQVPRVLGCPYLDWLWQAVNKRGSWGLARKDRSQEIILSNQKEEKGEQGSRRQSRADGKEGVTPKYQRSGNRRLKSSRWASMKQAGIELGGCVQDKGHSEVGMTTQRSGNVGSDPLFECSRCSHQQGWVLKEQITTK